MFASYYQFCMFKLYSVTKCIALSLSFVVAMEPSNLLKRKAPDLLSELWLCSVVVESGSSSALSSEREERVGECCDTECRGEHGRNIVQ